MVGVMFLPFRFEENDDVVMLLLASGNYTGSYESNLIFINPIYGSMVAMLYSFFKGVEWYTLLFVFFHFIAFSVVVYKLISIRLNKVFAVACIIFFSVIVLNFLMYLQFTTVALMLCLAAIMLFHDSNRKRVYGIVLFLTLLAALIRSEIVLLMMVAALPYLLFVTLKNKQYLKMGISLLLLLIPFVCIQLRDNTLISEEWKEATRYNRLRAEVTDNINADFSVTNYKGVCSLADYTLLKHFFIAPEYFNIEKLDALNSNIQRKELQQSKVKNIPIQLTKYLKEFSLISLILLTLLFLNPNKREVYLLLLYGAFLVVLMSYLSLDGLLKNRVFMGFVLVYIAIMAFVLSASVDVKKTSYYVISCLVLVFSFYYLRRLNEKVEETHLIRSGYLTEQLEFLNNYFKQYPDKTLIPFGDDLKIQYVNPFKISTTVNKWNLFYLGWMTNNPFNKQFEMNMKTNFTVFMSQYTYQKIGYHFNQSVYFGKYTDKEIFKANNLSIHEFNHK